MDEKKLLKLINGTHKFDDKELDLSFKYLTPLPPDVWETKLCYKSSIIRLKIIIKGTIPTSKKTNLVCTKLISYINWFL
ncbi:MAG: hypothetical protein HQK92_06770 [Nitrospirae bacterium]|nr:hypothetical protein [Nitrospirota bacterium]